MTEQKIKKETKFFSDHQNWAIVAAQLEVRYLLSLHLQDLLKHLAINLSNMQVVDLPNLYNCTLHYGQLYSSPEDAIASELGPQDIDRRFGLAKTNIMT